MPRRRQDCRKASLDQGLGPSARRNPDCPQGCLCQPHLGRLRTGHHAPDGQALALCDQHQLAPFASFGHAHRLAPFLAGTNVPSRKAWAHCRWPCASRRARYLRQRRSQTPSRCHRRSRRQQVRGMPHPFIFAKINKIFRLTSPIPLRRPKDDGPPKHG